MNLLWLAILCGVGCLSAAGSAVLLSGRRDPATAAGGALAFVAVLLVLVCAGVTVARTLPTGTRASEGAAEKLLDEMIERQLN